MLTLKYDEKEDLYYEDKSEIIKIFVDLLVKIFKDTLRSKEVFNVELLVRQNFLTILETDGYLESIFDQHYPYYLDEDGEYYQVRLLEEEIIDKVMSEMELVDIGLDKYLWMTKNS
ncbi:MAG: hypothetical protein J6I84_02835 [Bacilli bacterium]|nr:hypothetical protein [Bacilli bacterium]